MPHSSSLLSLPDDALLRIFHYLLDSNVLDTRAFSRLPLALPLATVCSRLHHIFFSSVYVLDLATIPYPNVAHFHNASCTSCASLVSVSNLFVFIRRAAANLRIIRLPPLSVNATTSVITHISQYCSKLEQLHFTDSGSVILPLAHCLLRLPRLLRLSILHPSQIIISALVTQPLALTHLALFFLNPLDAHSLVSLLTTNGASLRALTLSFRDAPNSNLHPPPPVSHFFTFIAKHFNTYLPQLAHLDISTASSNAPPNSCSSLLHHSVAHPPSLHQPIHSNGVSHHHPLPIRRIVLRTDASRLHPTISLLSPILALPIHIELAVDDLCVQLPPSASQERHQLLNFSRLPARVLSSKLTRLIDRDSDMFHADLTCLHSLDVTEGRQWPTNEFVLMQILRLSSIASALRNTLTSIRFLAFPSFPPFKDACSTEIITDLLRTAANLTHVDMSCSFIYTLLRRNDLAEVCEAMPNVSVIRLLAGWNRSGDGWSANDEASVATEMLFVLPGFVKAVTKGCPSLSKLELHTTVHPEFVQMSNHIGSLVSMASESLEKATVSMPGIDVFSMRAQVRMWLDEFSKSDCHALYM